MKLYASCQYKCGDNKQLNCNYNCRLGHDNMATGSGDYPDNTTTATTNSPSPSSLYSSCPQLNQYRSLPRNIFSALRRQQHQQQYDCLQQHLQNQHQQQQQLQNCVHQTIRTNSEQELRRSALLKSTSSRYNNKNIILCGKCAV